MSFGTPWAVLLTILFLVPGFLWKKTSLLACRYKIPSSESWLDYFVLSCFNYLLGWPLLFFLLSCRPVDFDILNPSFSLLHGVYFTGWIVPVFFLPVLAGFLTGRYGQKDRSRGFLKRFGLFVLHVAPTAWDYAFARDESFWARIELVDGRMIEGVFADKSLASSEPGERDIFLEPVYELNEETGQYIRQEVGGILIMASSIRMVRFFKCEGKPCKGVTE
ncbi:MAG TPA: DUF6338 family protein [Planctomycetota bacterium]|nr:DUF6338 family protein [Planctomycetota bacterium]